MFGITKALCCPVLLAVVDCVAAYGGMLQVFNSQTSFFSAAPIVSTETFDEFPSDTLFPQSRIMIDGVYYLNTPEEPGAAGWGILHLPNTPSQPNALVSSSLVTQHISFGQVPGHTTQVAAFGFYLNGGGSYDGVSSLYRIVVSEADGTQTSFTIDFGPTRGAYFGFLSEQGIATIAVGPDFSPGFATYFAFDNVSRSGIATVPTPEPRTWSLISLPVTLGGCFAIFRRRRNIRHNIGRN